MLVYFGIILVVLLGFCGLAIDVGRMELRTAQLQAAADEGAISAAAEAQRTTQANQQSAALNAASTNVTGFLSANNIPTANTTVSTVDPASAGTFANDLFAVQTTITQKFPLYFMGLLTKSGTTSLSASSVALIPPCVFLFSNPGNATANAGLHLASSGIYSPCPVYARSGFVMDSFSSYNYGQPRTSGTSGGSSLLGNMYPTPVYNTPVLADPLAYLTAPTFSTCDHTNSVYTTPQTLQPGTYCGGLTVSNTTVSLQPGLYIVTGGVHFTSNATVNGAGVTMYLTKGGGSGFGTFRLDTGAKMYVSAPTDSSAGGIPGILLFGDRSWVGGNEDFTFNTATFNGDGIIYVRGTGMYDWSCNMTGPNYFGIVTENIYLFGASIQIANNYSSLRGGNPLHVTVGLVQ